MTVVLAIMFLTTAVTGSVLLARWTEQAAERASLVGYALRFPRGLPADEVEHFIAALAGLLLPWWKRWLRMHSVLLETTATAAGIEHSLYVPDKYRHLVENALQAHLPSVRYTRLDAAEAPRATVAAAYRLSVGDRSLRVDATQLSVGLLTSLQPLAPGEVVTVQWALTPAGPVQPARPSIPAETPALWPFDERTQRDAESVSALRNKQSTTMLLATARIGVRAHDAQRARALLRRTEGPWHASRAPGVHLKRRLLPAEWVASSLNRRTLPLLAWPIVANAQELSGLIGIPVEAEQIPGLLLGGCRQLAPSPLIPRSGLVIGEATFPGSQRAVAIDRQAQLRHLHVVGPTGVGKSTLLLNAVLQDIRRGTGVTVLDPKGDLVADILERIPPDRAGDVIVLDASDDQAPVGLNPLRTAGADGEVVVENLVGLMHSLWKFSWGPRTDDILRAALLTLVRHPGMSLVEVPALLLQDGFRRRLLGKLDDPVGLESFWGWYQALSDAERSTVVAAPLNKLRSFTMRPRIRRIIGQSNPSLDLRSVLSEGKILLVNLASGLLGADAAALLGALVVAELWHATTARAGMPADRRRLHVAYIDEFQHFLHLPTPIATVLAEARGLGLGLVLAHQHLHQLPTEIKEGVLANARSRVIFQAAASDAHALTKELSSSLTPDDLQGLGAYEIVASLFAGGQVAPPCTARTFPAPVVSNNAAAIREASRARYGRPVAEIDAEINGRTASGRNAPVGAKSRSQRWQERNGGTS